MKIQIRSSEAGSALVTVLMTGAILGLGLASYLSLASNQTQSVTRSQLSTSIIPLAEAGLEEAMSQINSTNNWAANGWTYVTGGLALSDWCPTKAELFLRLRMQVEAWKAAPRIDLGGGLKGSTLLEKRHEGA